MTWLVPLLLVGLSAAALLDVWRLPRPLVPGPPALVWTALFIALPGFGAAVWFLIRYVTESSQAPAPLTRAMGPDDDPDFLRSIEPHRGESS